MKCYKTYQFRLYPNNEQKKLIDKTIGSARFVFNHFLALWQTTYKETGKGLSQRKCSALLPELKNQEATEWLKEVDSIALQNSIKNLVDSYRRFFKKQNKYPKFKSKKNPVQTYKTNNVKELIVIKGNKIKLPKLSWVKFVKSRNVGGQIINVTVKKNNVDKYFISILTRDEVRHHIKMNSTVGIDLGIKNLAILSNGKIYPNPRFSYKWGKKLIREKRILSRRQERAKRDQRNLVDSKNYQKQKIKVAKIHEKIKNSRLDYLHKVSTEIIKNHDIIGIEDLPISNMLLNPYLGKAISDTGWNEFVSMLEYKAEWYGKQVIKIARNFPSSQLCSTCGHRNREVKNLKIRNWQCSECHAIHDRDVNASKNIKKEAENMIAASAAV